ncbi:MAG TPA: UbiA family prenyltransferase [Micromonosporaceae bacterium]|nr:UbiA family prenyltransferase [Micromonosporaceae bacterium]
MFVLAVELVGTQWTYQAWLGVIVSFLVPFVANLHNAYTDLDEDQRNLPGRVRLVNQVGSDAMSRTVKVLLAAVLILCATASAIALLIAVVGGALLLSYSANPIRAKARPLLGLCVFSLVVAVPYLAGCLISNGWLAVADYGRNGAIWLTAYFFIWFIAKGFVKNVPDYHGDKAAGLRTSATIMPSLEVAARVAAAATVAVYCLFPIAVVSAGSPRQMLYASLWVPIAAANALALMKGRTPREMNRVLKWDMVVTTGFLATVVLTVAQTAQAMAVAIACVLAILILDRLSRDSRDDRLLAVNSSKDRGQS